jgi:hypothetical protein
VFSVSKETYFSHATGLDRSHRAIPDLTHTTTYSASLAAGEGHPIPLPQLTLYEHLHFEGGSASTTFDWRYVGDWWTNKIASLVVISGIWEIYSDRDYKGGVRILGPGYYDDVTGSVGSIRARR